MYYFVNNNNKNTVRFAHVPCDFISLYLIVFTFPVRLKNANYKSLKCFSILRPMKNNVRFEYVPWKNVCFCFIPMVWVHFSHRIKKSRFWKSLKYFKYVLIKKRCHIWIYPMGKCLILFHFHFWVHFSHKIEKFRFWKSLKYYVLIKKDMLSDLNISHGKMSEFVHFHCLGSP